MKDSIEKTMNELRADHRNMSMLLDLLDGESMRLADDQDADYELINDVMTYMTEYPDAVHHPKEDLIYGHIHDKHEKIDKQLEYIEKDHRELEEASHEIRQEIAEMGSENAISRESLAESLREYSRHLREHMFWEEKELFELGDSMNDDDAWADILKDHAGRSDPIFGNRVERRFRKLFNSIQRRIVWDSQQYFT